jgi:AcrR family transcriptional regulator
MARNVKRKNRDRSSAVDSGEEGRVAQRNRTRRAIVEATMELLAAGGSPSIVDIAKASQVSRRTIYMYFPTLEQLLLDATIGALSARSIEPEIQSDSTDAAARVDQLSRALNKHAVETMKLGRAMIRLTVEGQEPATGGPRRGYRRVQWIENALAPAREQLTRKEFDRLVSAVCLLIGWEPIIVLKDVRGLEGREADEVLSFAVHAVVEAALASAKQRGKE